MESFREYLEEESNKGWKVTSEVTGVKKVSTKKHHTGVTIKKIEVWSTGRTGRTMLGSPAVGMWKLRGYRVNDKFYKSYSAAVRSLNE